MDDEIIVSYKAVPSGFDKVGAAVNSVTAETKELQNQIKATFADKSIEEATKALYEQGDVMGALVAKYGNATTALKAMEKELATMSALGQRGTASFNELAAATAELKDNIGDTRNEIKKMASDTRVFDTMVQGARGISAAFSVATGVAAAFGSQNKDLEKALLKVQGAMAALQGVQELANIATEKGGIATKAYGVALRGVEIIAKTFGLTMAQSWAVATLGISVLVAGVISLISYFNEAEDASSDFAAAEKKRYDEYKKQEENRKEAIRTIVEVEKKALEESDRMYDRRRKQAVLDNKDVAVVELGILEEKLKESEQLLISAREREKQGYDAGLIAYRKSLEDRILDTKVAYKKIFDTINTPQVTPTDNVTPMNTVGPLVTTEVVDMNKRNAEQMNADLKQYAFDKSLKDQELYNTARIQQEQNTVNAITDLAQNMFSLVSSLYSAQLAELEQSKERELSAAGDNAEKRKKIEQKYAIESAKIARQKAIAEKTQAIFGIAVTLAQAIQKITSEAAALAANPATAALAGNAYAQLGIAIASSAVQIAAVSAQPLPEIPKFEKGGAVVLAGGRSDDGMLWGRSHREGGMLINAQGGEYIWDIPTVKRHGDLIKAAHENRLEDLVFHKYIAPALTAPKSSYQAESYDDVLLRKTIRDTSERSTKAIVKGISQSINDSAYFKDRYK